MSGRVGDLSPQQQEALTRVRSFEGVGEAWGGAERPPGHSRERGPWRARVQPVAPAHRLSRELGTHLGLEPPSLGRSATQPSPAGARPPSPVP